MIQGKDDENPLLIKFGDSLSTIIVYFLLMTGQEQVSQFPTLFAHLKGTKTGLIYFF